MTEHECAAGRVDMLAEAREAQWTALAFMGDDAIKVVSPAKVNLFLGVGGRMDGGYHEVTNVMHALALHDSIYMTCRDAACSGASDDAGPGRSQAEAGPDASQQAFAGPDGCLSVRIEVADKTQMLGGPGAREVSDIPVEDNLVFKAIDMLAREVGRSARQDINIRIDKHIPMQAGLAGGSSNAAAALVGMAHFWEIPEDGRELRAVASRLGADVAFFLEGGCGLFSGAGDVFERRIKPMKHALVLVKPGAGVSTAECYAAFDVDPVPVPAELLSRAKCAEKAEDIPLFNNLAPAARALLPELSEAAEWLSEREGVLSGPDGLPLALLSGSGSATYAVVDTYAHAARIACEAGAKGWWARATSFSSLRALKV